MCAYVMLDSGGGEDSEDRLPSGCSYVGIQIIREYSEAISMNFILVGRSDFLRDHQLDYN